jgi:8-amino-7-oxononanoate synthase
VMEHGALIRDRLGGLGYQVGESETPIVPVLLPDALDAVMKWRSLLEAGVYTNPVVPPAASPRLRTSYMATHTPAQLEAVIEVFAETRSVVNAIN